MILRVSIDHREAEVEPEQSSSGSARSPAGGNKDVVARDPHYRHREHDPTATESRRRGHFVIETAHSLLKGGESMRCPDCNTENPEGAKFCIQWASPLKRACQKCGYENPPEARFCAQCAASLTGNDGGAQTVKSAQGGYRHSPVR